MYIKLKKTLKLDKLYQNGDRVKVNKRVGKTLIDGGLAEQVETKPEKRETKPKGEVEFKKAGGWVQKLVDGQKVGSKRPDEAKEAWDYTE